MRKGIRLQRLAEKEAEQKRKRVANALSFLSCAPQDKAAAGSQPLQINDPVGAEAAEKTIRRLGNRRTCLND